jgi:hypothetical protein
MKGSSIGMLKTFKGVFADIMKARHSMSEV